MNDARNLCVLLFFEFPHLCMALDLWSNHIDLVFLRGTVALVA
jgi:hypothetical protein